MLHHLHERSRLRLVQGKCFCETSISQDGYYINIIPQDMENDTFLPRDQAAAKLVLHSMPASFPKTENMAAISCSPRPSSEARAEYPDAKSSKGVGQPDSLASDL